MAPEPPRPIQPEKPGAFTLFIGSGFLTGYAPFASGTVASALAAVLYYAIPGFEDPFIGIPLIAGLFLIGIRASGQMETYYGHDPAEATVDEVVGMWISLAFLPKTLLVVITGFFLFRIFDIVKPYPARRFEQQPGGYGIMMDDVVAAVYANILLHLLLSVLHLFGLE